MLLISTHRKIRFFFLLLTVICISFFTTAHTNAATEVPVKKVLYLTIDDGPSIYTAQILDILKKYQAKATFFMLEPKVKQCILTTLPQLLEYARKNGYETRILTTETPVYNYMR